MDFALLGVIGGATGVFSLFKGLTDYNKTQREAGAKEERDKNRDAEIKNLWNKIFEIEELKKELAQVTFSLGAMEKSIEKLIIALEKHVEKEGK